jgi:hypothetical protein
MRMDTSKWGAQSFAMQAWNANALTFQLSGWDFRMSRMGMWCLTMVFTQTTKSEWRESRIKGDFCEQFHSASIHRDGSLKNYKLLQGAIECASQDRKAWSSGQV